jgi:hypothetical protein
MKAEDLLNTHPMYQQTAKEADFFYRSYVGGKLYQKGEYLIKYLGEDNTPGDSYGKRIGATPLDNHVKTTVDIYSSFIFRNLPKRTLGQLYSNPSVQQFMKNTDQNGMGLDSFMKSINDMALVLGSVWLLVDKPNYAVSSAAEAEALGIKPYVCAYTPQNVLDWEYTRSVNGTHQLSYVKVLESETNNQSSVTEWFPDRIVKTIVQTNDLGEASHIVSTEEFQNPLGIVPFINYAPLPAPQKGIGYSVVGDVAYSQKYIYNLLSELEQNIRISGHPSLVKTPSTRASAGAGAIIEVQEDMEPGLKPYLLQPSGSSIDGILDAIDKIVHSIHRMTHTSAVQIMRGSPMSGVALATERQLLNTKLAQISQGLEETEQKIWNLFMVWQELDMPEDFSIHYAQTFDIRDEHSDLELYRKALTTVSDPKFVEEMNVKVAELLIENEETLKEVTTSITTPVAPDAGPVAMQHPTTTAETRADHIRQMIAGGYADVDILQLHPEISQEDINRARNSD